MTATLPGAAAHYLVSLIGLDLETALGFVIGRIVAEANRSGEPLSDRRGFVASPSPERNRAATSCEGHTGLLGSADLLEWYGNHSITSSPSEIASQGSPASCNLRVCACRQIPQAVHANFGFKAVERTLLRLVPQVAHHRLSEIEIGVSFFIVLRMAGIEA